MTDQERAGNRRRTTTAQRSQEIVTAAAALFDRAGYANTSMEDIARAVGLAKPTVYHYFASKDEILSAIHGQFIDRLLGQQERRQATDLRPDQQLLEVMADILEVMETHPGHVRVFFEHHRELPPAVAEQVRQKRDRYEAMVRDVLDQGSAQGQFRAVDLRLASLAVFGMCNWAYQWYRPDGPLRSREIAYAFWGYLVHGLGRAGGPVDTAPPGT